jgi:CheY-like chemotaxis protein
VVIGPELVARVADALPSDAPTSVVVFAPEGLSPDAERARRRLAQTRPVRVAQTPDRLLDDVTRLMHVPTAHLSERAQATLDHLHNGDTVLAGRKVLIVDDDIRNIFAMTSMLETHAMEVYSAENGKDGIEKLQATEGVDIVLMDIMMPDMDGYDTIRAIRGIPAFRSIPIVAVTAKAMKGDREKCIEAGAWDYLPKPVAPDQLLTVFRTWLHR